MKLAVHLSYSGAGVTTLMVGGDVMALCVMAELTL